MTTEITTRDMNDALERPKEMESILEGRADELDVLLRGSGVDRDQFVRGVVLGIAANPDILAASRNSILLACLEAAEMGLVPSGQFGGAYLVKYKRDAQLIVDWRGYIKMLLRSGQVTKVEADNVYENDEFDYERGTSEFIRHRPTLDRDRGRYTHSYAIATLPGGDKQFEVMTEAQIDAIRSGKKGVWVSHPEEMRRKTAVRRLAKYLPQAITPQLQFALERDDRLDAEAIPDAPRLATRRDSLAQRIVMGDTPDEAAEQVGREPVAGMTPDEASEDDVVTTMTAGGYATIPADEPGSFPLNDEDLPDIPQPKTEVEKTGGPDLEQDELHL